MPHVCSYNNEPVELEELERSLNDERRSTAPVCGKAGRQTWTVFRQSVHSRRPAGEAALVAVAVSSVRRLTGCGSLCGASVIDSRHVLTATYCVSVLTFCCRCCLRMPWVIS